MPSLTPLSQICCRRPACICDRPSRFICALCREFTYPFSVLIFVAGGGKNPLSTRLTRLFAVIGVQPLSEAALGAIISEPVFWRRCLCTLSYSKSFRSNSQLALERENWRWNAECARCREECFCSGDQVRGCSFVTRYTSYLTPHTSHVTPHTSHLTRLQTVRKRLPRPSSHPQQKPIRFQLSRCFQSCHWHLRNFPLATLRRIQRVALDDARDSKGFS
jgi:hypothetical protein